VAERNNLGQVEDSVDLKFMRATNRSIRAIIDKQDFLFRVLYQYIHAANESDEFLTGEIIENRTMLYYLDKPFFRPGSKYHLDKLLELQEQLQRFIRHYFQDGHPHIDKKKKTYLYNE